MATHRERVIACADRPLVCGGPVIGCMHTAQGAFRRVAILVAFGMALSGAIAPIPATAQPAAPQIQRAASGLERSLDLQTELPVSSPEQDPIRIDLPAVVRVLVWILVICGAACLAYFLRDILPAGGLARRSDWDDRSEPSVLGRPQDGAAAQVAADDLAQQGRFVEAMHVLLLQGLDEMRKRLDLRFADSLTSREIMRRANVSPGAKAALRQIIDWVERAYFGSHPAVAGDYAACRQSFVAFAEALKQGTST